MMRYLLPLITVGFVIAALLDLLFPLWFVFIVAAVLVAVTFAMWRRRTA